MGFIDQLLLWIETTKFPLCANRPMSRVCLTCRKCEGQRHPGRDDTTTTACGRSNAHAHSQLHLPSAPLFSFSLSLDESSHPGTASLGEGREGEKDGGSGRQSWRRSRVWIHSDGMRHAASFFLTFSFQCSPNPLCAVRSPNLFPSLIARQYRPYPRQMIPRTVACFVFKR